MICCREVAILLIDYIARELPDDQHQQVDEHLGCCPSCVAYVHSYQRTIHLCKRLPPLPVPPEVIARLHASLS